MSAAEALRADAMKMGMMRIMTRLGAFAAARPNRTKKKWSNARPRRPLVVFIGTTSSALGFREMRWIVRQACLTRIGSACCARLYVISVEQVNGRPRSMMKIICRSRETSRHSTPGSGMTRRKPSLCSIWLSNACCRRRQRQTPRSRCDGQLALRLSAEAPGSHQSPVTLQRNATNCAVATIKHDLCCQLSDDGKSIHQGAFSPPFLTLWRTQELPDSPPFPRWMHDFALERDDLVDLLGPPLADDDIVPPTACVIAWFSSFIPHLKNASNIMTRTRKGKACDNTKAAVHSNQEAEADMQLRWGLMATSEEPMCLMCGLSHDDLVEAVHIVPRGEYEVANCGKHTVLRRPVPVVDNISNGLLLCKNCRTLFEKFHWTARMDEQGIFRIALMTPNSRMPHRERDGQPLFPGDGRDAARSPLFLWLHAEAARQVHAPPQQLNADYGNGNWFASMAPAPQLGLMASTVASGSPAAASAATSSPSTTFRKCLMESSSELPARLAAWTILGQYGVIGCGGLEYL
ncbi:hypothetical protein BDZ88DRAFT_429283 [Geranomyces variabilis]|nr:hypothetical protein BDZ88DRAFT_429283 [Geranomyces variabilis]